MWKTFGSRPLTVSSSTRGGSLVARRDSLSSPFTVTPPTSATAPSFRLNAGCRGRRFCAWGLARTARELPSAQQRLKSRLRKVLVMRQRRLNLLRFHRLKARAICQTPTLIRRLLVAPQRALKLFRCLRNDHYIPIAAQPLDHAANSMAQRTSIAKTVKDFRQHHFAGHDSYRRKLLRYADGLRMNLVPRIHKRNPIAGVGEDLLHLSVLLLP